MNLNFKKYSTKPLRITRTIRDYLEGNEGKGREEVFVKDGWMVVFKWKAYRENYGMGIIVHS